MNPILTIARFDLRYQLRQPSFYLFAVLVFGQGIWYAVQLSSLYPYSDSVITTYLLLSSLGVLLAVAAALLAGQSLTKDIDYKTTPYLFTLPITSRTYLVGRFIGTYGTVLLLALFYPLGITAYSAIYSPNVSLPWLTLADGFIRLIIQNLFIVVSLTFSLTIFLRSMRGAYIGLFLVVFYFILTDSPLDFVTDSDVWTLLDPFGVSLARDSVESTPFGDEPDSWLVFSDMLLINRLLWLGLAMGLLAYAENTFTFTYFATQKPVNASLPKERGKPVLVPVAVAAGKPQFGGRVSWQTIGRSTKLEFLNQIKGPVFLLTIGLLVLITLLLATALRQNPDFPTLPITSQMTALRLPMGLFISLFLLVITTELLFRERTVGFWSIYDALPQSTLVLQAGKLAALSGIAALLTGVLFLTTIGVQLASGFTDIDWWLYGTDFVVDGFLRFCQWIALGTVVSAVVNQRLASHIVNLLLFSALFFTYQFSTTGQFLYLYSFLPGSSTYSDLVGYGSASALRPVVHVLWWGVAGVFITAFLLTWSRGVAGSLSERLHQWQRQFYWPYRLAFFVFGLLLGLSFWQTQQYLTSTPATQTSQYRTQTKAFRSLSGRTLNIRVKYHHPYQVSHIIQATERALRRGEELFGAYPFDTLHIAEIPAGTAESLSAPGAIQISEKQGWAADDRQPDKLDYIDYVISREVFKQWLVQQLRPTPEPGSGFVRQSLPEYLALQTVYRQYSPERFEQRLSQRAVIYAKSRQRNPTAERSLLRSSHNDGVERGRAALVLTSIGEVWGTKPLSQTISQFYTRSVNRPGSATARTFADEFARQLPDSLRYLQTYLSDQLWFDIRVGRVANLVNGLTVEVIARKWRQNADGKKEAIPIDDYLPLVVLNKEGRVIYRQLIRLNSDERFVFLPTLPDARTVVIDPLGAWPERNKRDNRKLL